MMEYFDDASGTWKTVGRLDDGSFVVKAPEQESVPTGTVMSAKIEQDPNYEGVPRNATNTRFSRELDTQAKIAMRKEQDKNGYQRAIEEGLMMATTVSPEGATKIRDASKRSTKQGIIEASKILGKKANELASASPDLARQYQDYSVKLREFGDQIQTKMQDAWYGANLRYGTPIGSGREGDNLGAKYPNGIGFIRPELEGKNFQQAMDDTLYTRFGKQTLGNRIDERKRYLRDNGEFVSAFSPWVPIASQWKSMKEEGLNLKDLSLEGAGNLAGAAGMQGLGYLLPAAGGAVGLVGTAALQTMADLYQTPERPDSEDFYGDVAKDATASAAGGMLPGIGAAAVKKLNKARKAVKASTGNPNGNMNPVTEERIRQNNEAIANLNRKIAENSLVLEGNPAAMQNAFVRIAGDGVEPEYAWMNLPGYLSDNTGARITKESPWVNYVMKEMGDAQKESKALAGKLANAKKASSDAELRWNQAKETPPTTDKLESIQQNINDVVNLNRIKMAEQFLQSKARLKSIDASIKMNEKKPLNNKQIAELKKRDEKIGKLQDELEHIDEKTSPAEYAKAEERLYKAIDSRDYKQNEFRAQAQDRLESLKKDLKKAFSESMRLKQMLLKEPRTQGFATMKRMSRDTEASIKAKQSSYSRNVAELEKKYNDSVEKVKEIEAQIEATEKRIASLTNPETMENYRRGAETLLKQKAGKNAEEWQKSIDGLVARNKLLEAQRMKASQGSSAQNPTYENPFISFAKAIPGGQFSAITSDIGLDMVQPEHKDTGSDKPTTLGNPFVNALRVLANRFTGSQNSPERYVNQYRGFKK